MVIRAARPEDLDFAFAMFSAAGHGSVERFLGCQNKEEAYKVVRCLWTGKPNALHYKNCHILEGNEEPLGFLSAYPVGENSYSQMGTLQIIQAGGARLLWHYLTHWKELFLALRFLEGKRGEYYINTLATVEKARGQGIGTKLLHYALDQAKRQEKETISLLVGRDNREAKSLYERIGFKVVPPEKQHPLVYRMVLRQL